MIATKSVATYINIFAGRASDNIGHEARLVTDSANCLERWKCASEMIEGSIRSRADTLGADIIGLMA